MMNINEAFNVLNPLDSYKSLVVTCRCCGNDSEISVPKEVRGMEWICEECKDPSENLRENNDALKEGK